MNQNLPQKALTKEIKYQGLIYLIDENKKKTAEVIGCKSHSDDIIIPYSFNNNYVEFTITSIKPDAFQSSKSITKIHFGRKSNIRTFLKGTFFNTNIECISFPENLTKLEDGWCKGVRYLKNVAIGSGNPFYKKKDISYHISLSYFSSIF